MIVWTAIGIALLGLGWGTAINFHLKGINYPVVQYTSPGVPVLDSEGKPKVSIENLRAKYPDLEDLVKDANAQAPASPVPGAKPDTSPEDNALGTAPVTGAGTNEKP